MVPTLPHTFTSVDQYERAMRNPLGPDWNTQGAFRNLTKPEVGHPA